MELLREIVAGTAKNLRVGFFERFADPFTVCMFHAPIAIGATGIRPTATDVLCVPPKSNANLSPKTINDGLTNER